jgi:hypothetical protein
MLAAAPYGAPIRVKTQLGATHDALREWASANGVVITCEDETSALAVGECYTEHALDLRRV